MVQCQLCDISGFEGLEILKIRTGVSAQNGGLIKLIFIAEIVRLEFKQPFLGFLDFLPQNDLWNCF